MTNGAYVYETRAPETRLGNVTGTLRAVATCNKYKEFW